MRLPTSDHIPHGYVWLILTRAIFGVIFGVTALAWPGRMQRVCIYMLAICILLDALALAMLLSSTRRKLLYGWVFLEGGILIGSSYAFNFLWPHITALLLLWLLALWSVFSTLASIIIIFQMSHVFKLAGQVVLYGILSFLLGLFLFSGPGTGILSLLFLLGLFNIVCGVLLFISVFQLRSLLFSFSKMH